MTVKSHSSILCNGLVSNLGVEKANQGGIQELLLKGAYTPSKSDSGITLNKVLTEHFVRSLAYDFERFSLSSRESYIVAISEKINFGSLGWPLLKFYYASFFSAHAIMRSRGYGIIKLDRKHIDHLNSISNIYDPSIPSLSPGMFLFKRVSSDLNSINEISINISPDSAGGGVHEGFWKNFCDFLSEEASRSVANGEIGSNLFVALSSNLSDAIKSGRSSNSTWLSSMRNEINYQHKYNAWIPYKKSSECYKALNNFDKKNIDSSRLDISKEKKPIEAFINVTCFITGLAFNICETVAEKSRKGGAFGQKWRKINNLTDA